ncbi:mucin-binding protein [Limosilactobacillus portuensis]|uniref:mucin-binding protein n=1 Tax=Limosilactobacillus portuensis TaxID=2742601 RepID=UPI003265EC4E
MLSKNNNYGRLMRSKSKQDHFSLRKLSVGVVSVVIGTTLYLGGVNSSVLADTNSSDNVTAETNSEAPTDGKTAVLPKVASDNDNNEAVAVKVNSNQEVNNETAKVKNANQKQEDTDKVENSSTNENVAENSSDSKKATSNSDVRVIKNDVTTDKKEVKNSEMVDNSKDMNTTTAEIHSLGVKVVGAQALEESKAETGDSSLSTGMTEDEMEKLFNSKNDYFNYSNVAEKLPHKITRTIIIHKPSGDVTVKQSAEVNSLFNIDESQITGGTTIYTYQFGIVTTVENNSKLTSQLVYQKNISLKSIDNSNNVAFASEADKEAYNKFMEFAQNPDIKVTLPAIDQSQLEVSGYSYTVSPANSNLGDWTFDSLNANSVEIEVNYKKVATNTVTYKFEDPFGNQVGTPVSVSGEDGSNQSVNLTLPDGYQLASGSLPTSVTIPDSDKTISIPVKHQLTINLSGESTIDYASYDWQNLFNTKELPASAYTPQFNDANARVQLSNGDVTYNENRNVGTYTVSLTEKGLNDIKEHLGDNFIYLDLKDVTSDAHLIINKGHKEIDLMGGDTKVFDNTSTLPDQGTFYSGLGLGDDDQGKISIYNSDGTLKTIQLTPNDVEFWLSGKKVTKDQAKSVGTYDLRLTDAFIQKVKDADGNNGNNYEWTYGPEYETAQYKIYQATGKAKLSGDNSKLYDGKAVTTAEVNKDGKITIDLTLPVYKQADEPGDEPQLLRTVDLGKYTLQDGDYTWANGTAPTKGGIYTINLNKDKILAHLQDRLVDLAGRGTDPDDSTKPLSNVTITADDMDGQATFTINTTVTYQFVDDDNNGSAVGKPVVATGLNGKSQLVHLTVPEGYALVAGQTLPATANFGDTNSTVDIHLKHATKTVDKNNVPDGYTKDDFAKEIKRSITAKEPTGDVDLSQTTELTRTGTYDEVTKKVVSYDNWTTGSFDEVTAPAVAGYTPSQASVAAVTGVTTDYVDPRVVITYVPNDQTGKISYIDVNTNTEVGTTPLTGKTNSEVTINPSAPTGWKIVDGQSIPKTEKATPTGIATVTVKVEHNTTTVQPTDPKTPSDKLPDNPGKNYPKGVDKKDLNKTITRTITVKDPHKGDQVTTQTATLTRTATVDEVTGGVTYSDWVPGTWNNFDVPAVSGYTPSRNNVPQQSVTDGTKDTTVTITYTPNDQTGKISYVDPNGKGVGTTPLTGKTDEEIPVTPNVPAGWQIVPGQDIPTTITATPDGIPTVTVNVEHKIITVTPTDPKTPSDKLPDNPGKNYPKGVDTTDLNKTITRKITVIKPDGTKEAHDQTVNLTRTATVDEVTGKVTGYSDWTTSSFTEYDAPEIPGYTPSGNVPAVALVTSTSDFTPIVITYIPTDQTVKYKFVDPQGKVVGVQTVPGKTGQTVPVNIHIPDGYQLVPGESVPTSYTFKDGNPDQIIKVALILTNGGQPTTNDHQGQGTPATNTPTNTTPNKNDVTGKLEGNVPNVQTGKMMTSQSTTAKDKQLPQTGNTGEKNAQIFGALSAGLAALVAGFVPNRRRDNK